MPGPAATAPESPAVAIVGMAGILPGSPDLDVFWQHLLAGDDLTGPAPADRLELHAHPDTAAIRAGFISDVAGFDAPHFGISPAEAALMDPQQRLFLHAAWRAIEDSGHDPAEFAGTDTGLFVGVSTTDYADLLREHGVAVQAHTASGIAHSILANRVSYILDLLGPSEAVDTACSSSLVALHRAVLAIGAGECGAALVGGVNVLLSPGLFTAFGKSGMLSGACKAFDEAADGYARGEGVGAVVLKPLAQARADGDPVYAVVRSAAVGHGGRAASLTAPNPIAQAKVITEAHRRAGIDPATVTAIEAHGTGTRLGDPVEIEGLTAAFAQLYAEHGRSAAEPHIAVGSVKTNIGHLEAAAGMAGLLKMLLAMRHGVLPPTIHYRSPNPYLRLSGTPFFINTQARDWLAVPDGDQLVRRAGVSSFGFGGTNAHVVLESCEGEPPRRRPPLPPATSRRTAYWFDGRGAGRGPNHPVVADPAPAEAAPAEAAPAEAAPAEAAPAPAVTEPAPRPRVKVTLTPARAQRSRANEQATPPPDPTMPPAPARSAAPIAAPAAPAVPIPAPAADANGTVAAPRPAASRDPAVAVRREIADILGLEAAVIPPDRPLAGLGLDSIFRVDLIRRLNAEFGLELQAAEIYEHDTVNLLTAYLIRAQAAGGRPDPETQPGPAQAADAEGDPEATLTRLFAAVIGRRIDAARDFSANGTTSFDMLRVISALERTFGALPKTLLFDHPSIPELAEHLAGAWGHDQATALLARAADGVAGPATGPVRFGPVGLDGAAPDSAGPNTIIVRKRDADPGMAALLAELERQHGKEGGLAGRDIAPLAFIGAERRAYFNFSRSGADLLAWSYVGSDDDFPVLAAEWLDYGRRHDLRVSFLSLLPLGEAGQALYATPFGAVQRLTELDTFTLSGSKMGRLRYMVNRFARSGDCRTAEYKLGQDPSVDLEIADLIGHWGEQKQMINPYVAVVREEVRRGVLADRHRMFLTRVGGQLVNAVIITKIPSENGYLLDLEFYPKSMPTGGLEFAMIAILEQLRDEGSTVFSFGASFGVAIGKSPNADPLVVQGLAELRSVGIFGEANFQFKNKFRPVNHPIYLCQPADSERTAVADVILMIANPALEDAGPAVDVSGAGEPDPAGSRAAALAASGYNVLALPSAAVETDLATDSWAEQDGPVIQARMRRLRELAGPGAVFEVPDWLPFDTVIPTPSGRAAEDVLCRCWPGPRGQVLHNGLFPTWQLALADHNFSAVRVPVTASPGAYPGDLDQQALAAALDAAAATGGAAFLAIELSCNEAGGYPISLESLTAARDAAASRGVPLVLDATRIIENALFLGGDPWSDTRSLLQVADAATFSLSKDFGLTFGGLVAARRPELAERLRDHVALRGQPLSRDARAAISAALAGREDVAALVRDRMAGTQALHQTLTDAGVPVLTPAAGHCVLLDTGPMPGLRARQEPVASCLAWIYAQTGIRGAPHLGRAGLIRLAVPLGLPAAAARQAGQRLAAALTTSGQPAPDLLPVGSRGRSPVTARYRPAETVPQDIADAMREQHQPLDQNAQIILEHCPQARRHMIEVPGGVAEVFTAGRGPVVALMHPFNIGAGAFARQFAALSEDFHLISMHAPGVGKTTARRDLTLPGIAGLWHSVLQSLGVADRVHVLGASFGGLVAQTYALTYPERTASLALVCSSFKVGNRHGEVNRLSVVAREDLDVLLEHAGSARLHAERAEIEKLLLRCESMDSHTGLSYLDVFASRPTLLGRLPEIAVPTLVVQGRHDTVIPVKTGHLLHGMIADSAYAELEAGHFPFLTHPDELHAVLVPFLQAHADVLVDAVS
jgi:3-oxoacyl-(acyl-carrier-protein) synthase/pimeloyl-ACP methyl ester carboxylesterase/tryptophanase/acyl carrier protein